MTHLGRINLEIESGDSTRLGAHHDGDGTNFALFSAHAERVELCIFDETGSHEIARIDLPDYTNEVWHGYVPKLPAGTLYGFRVHGPFEPEKGHRFNPHKLLLDPYARALYGDVTWGSSSFAYDLLHEDRDLSVNTEDNAAAMPKCVVTPAFTLRDPDRRRTLVPWDRTIFYETHVRGFTRLHPAVPEELRGTFEGLGHREVVDYIRSLGVTAVELLPIHAFPDDAFLLERGLRNYWGYNTMAFFAPARRYMGPKGEEGLRDMIRAFHDGGLEVILDVVYNHTAEGNELGPMLSFKGIDNASYYRLMPDEPRYYINDTGTGNTINTSHPRVLQMVMDSLRYWATEFEVDGFRFDLGSILGREPHGFDQRSGFFDAVGQDPILAQVKLVGEPWDIGPGGYQVGGFPPGWAEWNDKFRDTVRDYWHGREGMLGDFAARATGSGDVYDLRGRHVWSSVNFLCAHDGFTLNDLVSYNDKHNEANGEDNRDGHSDNRSFNHGAEGPTDDDGIRRVRERQKRNFLATLFLSHGSPMLLAGDEFGRSQQGNNNGYCQDNELSWLDWEAIGEEGRALTAFVSRLTALRHAQPLLRRSNFRDGMIVTWLNPTGGEQTAEQWADAGANTIGLRLSYPEPHPARGEADIWTDLLILYNAHDGVVPFALPERPAGWQVEIDTFRDDHAPGDAVAENYDLQPRSLVLMR